MQLKNHDDTAATEPRRPQRTPTTPASVESGAERPLANDRLEAALSEATAAVERVSSSLPSVLHLGRALAAAEAAYDCFDEIETAAGAGVAASIRAASAKPVLIDRSDALRDLITTAPAASLADVAVQIEAIAHLGYKLSAFKIPADEVEEYGERISRMARAALPIAAAAAGLTMSEMGWDGNDHLRTSSFAGVGARDAATPELSASAQAGRELDPDSALYDTILEIESAICAIRTMAGSAYRNGMLVDTARLGIEFVAMKVEALTRSILDRDSLEAVPASAGAA